MVQKMILDEVVVVRGGGDLATGTIHKLHRCGFRVLVLEVPNPTAIRRKVSFSEAIYDDKIEIEGITAVHVHSLDEVKEAWKNKRIPLMIDPKGVCIKEVKPNIVVDAIIAKKNLGTTKNMADITIALGPGFIAGKDVDVVIETARGHDLGRLILKGEAKKNTGIPGFIGGYSKERVIHSPCDGNIDNMKDIGDIVKKDELIAYVGNTPIKATISGLLRGIIRNGSMVKKGLKIGDIDPRISEHNNCYTISDKARNIAGGVLEAIFYMKNNKR
ncbi:selenium-dependent molybdenum cofactor biosynthesis protein YqeB [Crassaminicella profunda]|uniref:selenium-dependent molybdenum cofactor biosynthesis protein YqeB n=1 Tax=Crassaminicella profunda TaxID=1286698 RepID=UPI001CA77159|nr:selenium-dependent molybdenum cofactor biosynthesis protein YqeB [Crassaminicella profunda]QZY54046.1 EF2563 family selenium-dependent molybdenum hydroxylase system protein [Crassaminicella profunda]